MDRSTSRGRDAMTSSGRGGLGNIRPPSLSRERPSSGPDDFSSTRGREPTVALSTTEMRSTGRGGAGNMRSPSRDVDSASASDRDVRGEAERAAIRAHEEREREQAYSSGRGGAGNITRSLSRGRGPESPGGAGAAPQVHSSGRGGAGNIAPGPNPVPAFERGRPRPATDAQAEGHMHSTGRGGLANLTDHPTPPQDPLVHHPGAYESTGRGGAGNFSPSRAGGDGSRERSTSKEKGIAGLWNRMHGHGGGRDMPASIPESDAYAPTGGAPPVVGGGGKPAV